MREELSGQPTSTEEEINKSSLQRLNSQKEDTPSPQQLTPRDQAELLTWFPDGNEF